MLAGRLREVIRRLNTAIPSLPLTTLRDTLVWKVLRGELRVAEFGEEVQYPAKQIV